MNYEDRLAQLRRLLAAEGLSAFLVASAENRQYLTGFRGSAGLLWITQADAALLVDARYWEQAEAEVGGRCRVVRQGPEGPLPELKRLAQQPFGFEAHIVPFSQVEAWRGAGLSPVPAPPLVERLRSCKNGEEMARIRQAVALAEEAIARVLPLLGPGMPEEEVALELEVRLRRLGAEAAAFPPVVASGPRAAWPHARASKRRLQAGDLVLVDAGAVVDGYCSDITRTYAVGEASEKARELYRVVRRAQQAAIAALGPGVRAVDADAAGRAVIEAAGYGDQFGHGMGHGVGLQVHEGPRLGRNAGEEVVPLGAVLTVEPGIYLPGWGGIRIEDVVVVGPEGAERLSEAPDELHVVGG